MPTKSGALKAVDPLDIGLKEKLGKTSVLPHGNVQKNADDQPGHSAFRPLTEKEKNEFVNSLDAKGRNILAELMGKKSSSDFSAA